MNIVEKNSKYFFIINKETKQIISDVDIRNLWTPLDNLRIHQVTNLLYVPVKKQIDGTYSPINIKVNNLIGFDGIAVSDQIKDKMVFTVGFYSLYADNHFISNLKTLYGEEFDLLIVKPELLFESMSMNSNDDFVINLTKKETRRDYNDDAVFITSKSVQRIIDQKESVIISPTFTPFMENTMSKFAVSYRYNQSNPTNSLGNIKEFRVIHDNDPNNECDDFFYQLKNKKDTDVHCLYIGEKVLHDKHCKEFAIIEIPTSPYSQLPGFKSLVDLAQVLTLFENTDIGKGKDIIDFARIYWPLIRNMLVRLLEDPEFDYNYPEYCDFHHYAKDYLSIVDNFTLYDYYCYLSESLFYNESIAKQYNPALLSGVHSELIHSIDVASRLNEDMDLGNPFEIDTIKLRKPDVPYDEDQAYTVIHLNSLMREQSVRGVKSVMSLISINVQGTDELLPSDKRDDQYLCLLGILSFDEIMKEIDKVFPPLHEQDSRLSKKLSLAIRPLYTYPNFNFEYVKNDNRDRRFEMTHYFHPDSILGIGHFKPNVRNYKMILS